MLDKVTFRTLNLICDCPFFFCAHHLRPLIGCLCYAAACWSVSLSYVVRSRPIAVRDSQAAT